MNHFNIQTIFIILLFWSIDTKAQKPACITDINLCTSGNPPIISVDNPNKLCYNYDRAGNRINQNPSWIQPDYCPELCCTPNNPETSWPCFPEFVSFPPISSLDDISTNPFFRIYRNSIWQMSGAWNDDCIRAEPINTDNIVRSIRNSASQTSVSAELFPNPNVGQFMIGTRGFDIDKSMITIMNMEGVVVWEREFANGAVSIVELPVGMYILLLKDDKNSTTVRFEKKE